MQRENEYTHAHNVMCIYYTGDQEGVEKFQRRIVSAMILWSLKCQCKFSCHLTHTTLPRDAPILPAEFLEKCNVKSMTKNAEKMSEILKN